MLGMACALVGSSTYLTVATKIGLPVSTTHCIVGAIIGVGIAANGVDGVVWGWKGVSQIIAAWFIAPGIAGCFASIVFIITKYTVLKRENSFRNGLYAIPIYFAITSGILTMVIVWKGAPNLDLDDWTAGQIVGCVFGVAAGVAAIVTVFFLPFLYRKLMQEDWTLKWYHVAQGPLLLRRGPVPSKPVGQKIDLVQDYYRGHHKTAESVEGATVVSPVDIEKARSEDEITAVKDPNHVAASVSSDSTPTNAPGSTSLAKMDEPKKWSAKWFWVRGNYYFFRGVNHDPASEQMNGKVKNSFLTGDMKGMHDKAARYDNKTEHLYSFLQVMTAATASFAHGSNDVSNAMGPLSAIYLIWNTGQLSSKAPVPIWVLLFGGVAIVIGLWTYGYHIMRNLGNRLTLHSPSRGFSMELGAALTVVMATRLALPISTTQCIVGATVGVGLCNGDIKGINWRMVGWIYMGWFITLPCTGLIAGCLMGFIINAPQWGNAL
jgi:sodium-dependent phosphate transporter